MPDDLQDSFVRPRRRSNDKINWKRVAIYVLGSMPIWGPSSWATVEFTYRTVNQWNHMQNEVASLRAEVNALNKVAKEDHKGSLELHERRLDKIERWKCILGWNPHEEPRDRNRVCAEEQ